MPSGLWKTVQLILDDLLQNEDVETGMEIYSQFHSREITNGKDTDSFQIQALSIYLWALTRSELMMNTA